MNYIKHMNKAMELFAQDERLLPSHISLYLALFQAWNQNRFKSSFIIDRNELMQTSKIGSFTTFTRIIKDLHKWEYVNYMPSFSASKGSRIELYSFCIAEGMEEVQNCTGEPQNCNEECTGEPQNCTATYAKTVQPLYININKQIKHYKQVETAHTQEKNKMDNEVVLAEVATRKQKKIQGTIPDLGEVNLFFSEQKFPQAEAEKFYNHFQSNGWLVGGKSPMTDWQAGARNWMLNTDKFEKPKQKDHGQPRPRNLHTGNDKDYSEPL